MTRNEVKAAFGFYRAALTRDATFDLWHTEFAAKRRDEALAAAKADPRYAIGRRFRRGHDSLLDAKALRLARLHSIRLERERAAIRAVIAAKIAAECERARNGTGSLLDRVTYALHNK